MLLPRFSFQRAFQAVARSWVGLVMVGRELACAHLLSSSSAFAVSVISVAGNGDSSVGFAAVQKCFARGAKNG